MKLYREGKGWSQGQLARRLGVSRQTINAVETDKYDPSLHLALRMSKLFGAPDPATVDAIEITCSTCSRWRAASAAGY